MGVTSRPSTPDLFVAGCGPHPDPHTSCGCGAMHCSGCYAALGLMRCYCGQSHPGIWDERGIVHNGSECRYTDRYIATRWAYREAPKARSQR